MMTPEVVAVKRGAKLLDSLEPKWATKMKLATFDISDPTQCVLGQVHRDYGIGVHKLAKQGIAAALANIPKRVKLADDEWLPDRFEGLELDGKHYGFDCADNDNENRSWERLGQQWIREVKKRLKRTTRKKKR